MHLSGMSVHSEEVQIFECSDMTAPTSARRNMRATLACFGVPSLVVMLRSLAGVAVGNQRLRPTRICRLKARRPRMSTRRISCVGCDMAGSSRAHAALARTRGRVRATLPRATRPLVRARGGLRGCGLREARSSGGQTLWRRRGLDRQPGYFPAPGGSALVTATCACL